jgi:uncharacterized protein
MNPFHLAIPVKNLTVLRNFYKEILECSEGRSSEKWVDFNLYGHQLVLHQKENTNLVDQPTYNNVDNKSIPIPHFGVVLQWNEW